jgi:hypothetical protein
MRAGESVEVGVKPLDDLAIGSLIATRQSLDQHGLAAIEGRGGARRPR